VGGDGRLNENIGLMAMHGSLSQPTTISCLNPANLAQNAGNNGNNQALSGEELFQIAKPANENFYQHHVLQEYARRITPNLGAFAGANAGNNNNAGFNASILAEFASSAFRFCHSQLTEAVPSPSVNQQTGLANPGGQMDICLAGPPCSRIVHAPHGRADCCRDEPAGGQRHR
jgi:hypothetical protein